VYLLVISHLINKVIDHHYDNNVLFDLDNLKIESKKIKFQCTSEDGGSTGDLEFDFGGYWIYLNDVPTGEHIILLKQNIQMMKDVQMMNIMY
jgi:hypothetical protein